MTKLKLAPVGSDMKTLLLSDENGFRAGLQAVVQEALEAEMTEALRSGKSERTADRVGLRSGYFDRMPRDNQDEGACCLAKQCSRAACSLPHVIAPLHRRGGLRQTWPAYGAGCVA